MKDGKTLIVYFSRTGVTRRVAEALQKECGGELCEIQADRYPLGLRGFFRAAWDVFQGKQVPIRLSRRGSDFFSRFDTLIIGTPVWGGAVSAPVRSFLQSHFKNSGGQGIVSSPQVAFFLTHGSSKKITKKSQKKAGAKDQRLLRQMEKLCLRAPVATLEVSVSEVRRGSYYEKILKFVQELQETAVSHAA